MEGSTATGTCEARRARCCKEASADNRTEKLTNAGWLKYSGAALSCAGCQAIGCLLPYRVDGRVGIGWRADLVGQQFIDQVDMGKGVSVFRAVEKQIAESGRARRAHGAPGARPEGGRAATAEGRSVKRRGSTPRCNRPPRNSLLRAEERGPVMGRSECEPAAPGETNVIYVPHHAWPERPVALKFNFI